MRKRCLYLFLILVLAAIFFILHFDFAGEIYSNAFLKFKIAYTKDKAEIETKVYDVSRYCTFSSYPTAEIETKVYDVSSYSAFSSYQTAEIETKVYDVSSCSAFSSYPTVEIETKLYDVSRYCTFSSYPTVEIENKAYDVSSYSAFSSYPTAEIENKAYDVSSCSAFSSYQTEKYKSDGRTEKNVVNLYKNCSQNTSETQFSRTFHQEYKNCEQTEQLTEKNQYEIQEKPYGEKNRSYDEIEEMMSQFKDILPDGFGDPEDPETLKNIIGIKAIIAQLFSGIKNNMGDVSSFMMFLLGCALMLTFCSNMQGKMASISKSAVFFILSTAVFIRILPVLNSVSKSLSQINSFFNSLIPLLVGCTALGGGVTSASVRGTGMSLTLRIYGIFASSLLISLATAVFISGLLGSVTEEGMGRISKGIKNIFTRGMALLTSLLLGCLALQNIIANSADTAAMRTFKYAVSGTIPIVGGTVSSSLSVLSSGLSYVGNIMGGGSIAVILFLAVAPLGVLLAYKFCFFLSSLMLDFCCGESEIISSLSGALDTVISVYSMTSLIYILEIVVFLKGGVVFFG